jgi:branched-chain amino acid transport system permease protein
MAETAAIGTRKPAMRPEVVRRLSVTAGLAVVILALAAAVRAGVLTSGNPIYDVFVDPFVLMVDAPDLLVQTLWEGLVSGVLYALIALGFVLIFKASGVFNFAQGIRVVFASLTLVGLY